MPGDLLRPLSISLAVRAPRRMIFVPIDYGLAWQQCMEAALIERCAWWGGNTDVVVPLVDELPRHELFWALADVFDADTYEVAQPSGAQLRLVAPDAFEAWVETYVTALGGDASLRENVIDDLDSQVYFEQGIPPEVARLLLARLAPLDPIPEVVQPPFSLGHVPAMRSTELAGLPAAVHDGSTTLGPSYRLLLASLRGRLLPEAEAALLERDVKVSKKLFTTDEDLAAVCYRRSSYVEDVSPWGLSAHQLASYLPARLVRRSPILVCGDDVWDFALYYALSRLRGNVWWATAELWDDAVMRRGLTAALKAQQRRMGGTVIVTSFSPSARLESTVQALTRGSSTAEVSSWKDVIPAGPLRWFESGSQGHAQPSLAHNGQAGPLATPEPREIRHVDEWQTSWLAELSVEGWAPVRHPATGPLVLSGPNVGQLARTSRDGIAYWATGVMTYAGADLASSVVRPTLRLADLTQQLAAMCEAQGWVMKPSDKGAYAQRAAELFGGFSGLCGSLEVREYRRLFAAFLSGKSDPDAPGRWISAEGRRVMAFEDLRTLLGTEDHIEDLRETEVLQLGSLLKCARCRQVSWYDMDSFGRAFMCSRCRLDQESGRDAWMGREPTWFYRLDEALLQFLRHHGDLPVLAASRLLLPADKPLDAAFELELAGPPSGTEGEGARRSELDIAVSSGSELWVGEATTSDRLEGSNRAEVARLERLGEVAALVGARHVILATSGTWNANTLARARATFSEPWPLLHVTENCPIFERSPHSMASSP